MGGQPRNITEWLNSENMSFAHIKGFTPRLDMTRPWYSYFHLFLFGSRNVLDHDTSKIFLGYFLIETGP